MGRIVEFNDIYRAYPQSKTVTTSGGELSPSRMGKTRRTLLTITNTSATTVYVTFGDEAAVSGVGFPLVQGQTLTDADVGLENTWQGAVQAIATGTSTVILTEQFEP